MQYDIVKKKIVGTDISSGSYTYFLKCFLDLATQKTSSYVCVANVHMLIEGFKDPLFKKIVNEADIATPDGMPVAKAMKWLYGIEQDRVAGMDIMPDLMKICEEQSLSIFLYGSTDEILSKIVEKAKIELPNLHICGSYSPPFRNLNQDEKNNTIKLINDTNPDFVFVALGCPKQEKWMSEHKEKIDGCMIGLGGAFEVYAGVKNRAPVWMQKSSLEWLYRLYQDPKRLWKRYLYTNTFFVILLFKQLLFLYYDKLKIKYIEGI